MNKLVFLSNQNSEAVAQQAKESLDQFADLMASPELYPDLPSAFKALSPFLTLFSFAVGVAAIILILLTIVIVIRDVVALSLFRLGIVATDKYSFLKVPKVKKGDKEIIIDDIGAYIVHYWFKVVISLAFTVVLLSGQTLPLTMKVIQATSVVTDVAMSVDFEAAQKIATGVANGGSVSKDVYTDGTDTATEDTSGSNTSLTDAIAAVEDAVAKNDKVALADAQLKLSDAATEAVDSGLLSTESASYTKIKELLNKK